MGSFPLSRRLVMACGVAVLAGCASMPRSDLQTLQIEAVTPEGSALTGVRCALSNAAGEWTAVAPGTVRLSTDSSPLRLRCEADGGVARGERSVPAEVRSRRWLRGLAGGGIGLLVGGLAGGGAAAGTNSAGLAGGGGAVGAFYGTLLGTLLGAASAEPRYAYPDRVRVVLHPVAPPS